MCKLSSEDVEIALVAMVSGKLMLENIGPHSNFEMLASLLMSADAF